MYKILVVDDEKIVRIALKTIISEEVSRFKIVGDARDGVGALEVIKENDIDIVVTDLKMPNMDGIELIKNLTKIKFKGKILVLSNYDDYSLVRKAMKLGASDYLLKLVIEEDEFLNSLNQIADEIDQELLVDRTPLLSDKSNEDILSKETFLKNLIMNRSKGEDITKNINKLDINLNKNIIIFISIDNMRNEVLKNRIKDKRIFEQSVINILSDLIDNYYLGEVIGFEYKDFILIISVKDNTETMKDRIHKLALNISEMLGIYMNITASIVISPICPSVYKIGNMVIKCREAINYKFYTGDKSIIMLDEVSFDSNVLNRDYSKFIIELKENLRLKNKSKNIILFDNLFSKARENKSHPNDFKKLISIMIENLVSVLIEAGETDILYMDNNISALNYIETLSEYRDKVLVLLSNIHERIETIYKGKYRKEVADAIEYIKSNIDKKLSLKMIAEEINMNESYISRIFKDDAGETLIRFINKMKIEKAKKLLRDDSIIIKEVALSVGIQDQFYFIRMFKKYVGMSPSSYRHKWRK